jgi:hypothetical protein
MFGRHFATAAAILTSLWFGWMILHTVMHKKLNKDRS